MTKQEFFAALSNVSAELKVPKDMENKFGGYKYRNAEGILAAVKPLIARHGIHLSMREESVKIDERYYIQATARVTDGENEFESSSLAREPLQRKGMDEAQVTGSSISYARKYALGGLFGIDDSSADPDNPDNHPDNPATIKRDAKVKAKAAPATPPAPPAAKGEPAKDAPAPDLKAIQKAVDKCATTEELTALFFKTEGRDHPEVKLLFTARRKQIEAAAEMDAAI